MKEFFEITSVSREDLLGLDGANEALINSLDDLVMERIASKMSNDYLNQLYWDSLNIIARHMAPEAFGEDEFTEMSE